MRDTLVVTETLVTEICASCGVRFAMPEHLDAKRREDGDSFYCPNGHSLVFGSKIAALRKELAEVQSQRDIAKAERDRAEKALAEQRNLLKEQEQAHHRLQTRVRNGACEACNRSFRNLERHMRSKHPDLVKEVANPERPEKN